MAGDEPASASVALVGGPMDGQIMAVPYGNAMAHVPIEVAVPASELSPASFIAPDETAPCEPVTIETRRYVARGWDHGLALMVYVWEPDLQPSRPPRGERTQPRSMWGSRWRHCRSCEVKWWGDLTCWCCGKQVTPTSS